MKIRLYIDEDSMSRALVRALQANSVEVTTALAEDMKDTVEFLSTWG